MVRFQMPQLVFVAAFLGGILEGFAAHPTGVLAPKPLYRDPVYDGAADPSIIYDRAGGKWLMFYTNRRANVSGMDGVTWVHGTAIGVAESPDGARWRYRGTVVFPKEIPNTEEKPTFWAPAMVFDKGVYHMFVTVVPGVFADWGHPRTIVHVTSPDLAAWHYEGTLPLATNKVIDPCVFQMNDGSWRLWYNNESAGKTTYYADSPDLYHWTDKGSARLPRDRGEAPLVFRWRGRYWLLIDAFSNNGIGVYRSEDALNWVRQPSNLLAGPGAGKDDQKGGHHPEVVVSGDRAYLFYFVHPGVAADSDQPDSRRSSMQVVELRESGGWLGCDRNAPTRVDLRAAVPK